MICVRHIEKSLKSAASSTCWLLHPAGYTPTSHRYLPHTVPRTFNTPSHGSSTQKNINLQTFAAPHTCMMFPYHLTPSEPQILKSHISVSTIKSRWVWKSPDWQEMYTTKNVEVSKGFLRQKVTSPPGSGVVQSGAESRRGDGSGPCGPLETFQFGATLLNILILCHYGPH